MILTTDLSVRSFPFSVSVLSLVKLSNSKFGSIFGSFVTRPCADLTGVTLADEGVLSRLDPWSWVNKHVGTISG